MINMHHFHGAAARVPLADTAFGLRREHFMVELIAAWSDDDAPAHHAWSREAERILAPHALPGGCPNLLGPDRLEPTGTFSAIPLPADPALRTA